MRNTEWEGGGGRLYVVRGPYMLIMKIECCSRKLKYLETVTGATIRVQWKPAISMA